MTRRGDFQTAPGVLAGVDLRAALYHFVSLDGSGRAILAGAGGVAWGVLQNDPDAGEACEIHNGGATKARAGGIFPRFARLTLDTSGRVVEAVASGGVVAIALEASVGLGQIVEVAVAISAQEPVAPRGDRIFSASPIADSTGVYSNAFAGELVDRILAPTAGLFDIRFNAEIEGSIGISTGELALSLTPGDPVIPESSRRERAELTFGSATATIGEYGLSEGQAVYAVFRLETGGTVTLHNRELKMVRVSQ